MAFFCAIGINYLTHTYDNKYHTGTTAAIDGVLNYRGENSHKVTFLAYDWAFYQGALLTPADFAESLLVPDAYIDIGAYTSLAPVGETVTPHGCGTYRLRILLDETPRQYTLALPEIFSAYRLYLSGQLIHVNGEPEPDNYQPSIQSEEITFTASEEVDILLAVSDFSHYYSGLIYPPAFGEQQKVNQLLSVQLIIQSVRSFLALLLAISYLVLFFTGGKDKRKLYFSFVCFTFLLYSVSLLLHTFTATENLLIYRLEDSAFIAMLFFITLLMGELSVVLRKSRISRTILVIGCVVLLCSFLTPTWGLGDSAKGRMLYCLIIDSYKVLVFLYLLFIVGNSWWKRQSHMAGVLFSLLFFAISVLCDAIDFWYEPIYFGWGAEYGGFLLLLVLGCYLLYETVSILKDNQILQEQQERQRLYMEEVVHDLKSPLATITAYAELTRNGMVEGMTAQAEFMQEIEERSKELSRRIEKLRRIDYQEQEKLCLSRCNSKQYLIKVAEKYRPLALQNHLSLIVQGDSFPLYLDQEKMTLALENLVMNSIRYTASGGTIILEAYQQGKWAKILVTDTGEGMDIAYLNKIFSRGYTGEQTHSGLGLYIASEVVRAHHGTISVQSAPHQGSIFTLQIPNQEKENTQY